MIFGDGVENVSLSFSIVKSYFFFSLSMYIKLTEILQGLKDFKAVVQYPGHSERTAVTNLDILGSGCA